MKLLLTCQSGAWDKVVRLAQTSTPEDLRVTDENQYTPLHTVALWGVSPTAADAAHALVERGAPLEARSRAGMTPLLLAAWANHAAVVDALLDAGADIDSTHPRTNATPLMGALTFGQADAVRVLVRRGADLDVRGKFTQFTDRTAWTLGRDHPAAVAALEAGLSERETLFQRCASLVRKRRALFDAEAVRTLMPRRVWEREFAILRNRPEDG